MTASTGAARRVPVTTYRLQLGPDLSFDAAAERLPYLVSLGVTDLYLSPILTAAPGSTHGYDVVDHGTISAVMGGRAGFERLVAAARAAGLGVVLDIVPNHMAVPTPAWHNRALWSALRDGADSPYAAWFDVEWVTPDGVGDPILMPVLGERIGAVLAAGDLVLEEDPALGWVLRYFDHVFPVRPGTEQLPLTDLLDRQHYRLAYWKVAAEELNYRRFFDVDTLVAIRVEDPEVFEATHALVIELVRDGLVDGLRVDHPDGLADPRGYFRRLDAATDGAWTVAEKILEPTEHLPSDWPCAGTTGYDAAWRVGQVLIDPAGALPLAGVLSRVTGDTAGELDALIETSKREIATGSLEAEVHRLAGVMAQICADDVRLRDHTHRALVRCVRELVVACDRYRAYVVPGEPAPGASVAQVQEMARHAVEHLEADDRDTLDVVVDLVLGREVGSAGRVLEARRREAIVRFQQVCGAVMAKGVEDTAYYRWTHLTSLCEVGGAPGAWAITPDELHAWARETQAANPTSMTAGSTHDSKRGADVRARIGVLSQLGRPWAELVHDLHARATALLEEPLPGRTENLLWQTLAGTWTEDGPLATDRLVAYLIKAAREAKDWTTWTAPDAAGEARLADAVPVLLADPAVIEAYTGWVRRTAAHVRAATLGTSALQLTLPGVADVYQGTETTTIALVDPDNRRPVDAAAISARLSRLDEGARPAGLADEKLALTAAVLRLRRDRPRAFVGSDAGYRPLPTTTAHAVAYLRSEDERAAVVTVASRLTVGLDAAGGWGEHTVVLPAGHWRDVVSGATHEGGPMPLARLLADSPVAVLAVR